MLEAEGWVVSVLTQKCLLLQTLFFGGTSIQKLKQPKLQVWCLKGSNSFWVGGVNQKKANNKPVSDKNP